MNLISISSSHSYSYINRISLPMLWADKKLPENLAQRMKGCWTTKLGWNDSPSFRVTDALLNMLSNKIMPRETLIDIHQEIAELFKRQVAMAAKVSLRGKFSPSAVTLPPFSGKVTEPLVRGLINKIGVELEGGWPNAPSLRTKADGSVNVAANIIGEIAMPPYHPLDFPWEAERIGFYANYPEAVNDTCGMHVHFSFTHPTLYASLVCKEFTEWILKGLELWGKHHSIKSKRFYSRLHGQNRFCKREYWSHHQLGVHGEHRGERYSAVNYCLAQHGTVEIRVLPMFKSKEISRKAITELVRLVCVWLTHQAPQKEKAVLVATTEYDARELPKEFNFRTETDQKNDPGGVEQTEGGQETQFDPLSLVFNRPENS